MKTKPIETKLTKSEAKYIVLMFHEDCPELKGITEVGEMPLGCGGLFLENREQAGKDVYPSDHSISEKYLTAHKLPLTMTYKQWEKWLAKQPKALR